jgi:hypothetical protein
MPPASNPFQFGRELTPSELIDRVAEVTAVTNAMTRGGKLFLVGPRRYGKTSILRAAEERVTRGKGIVLRYDAEAFTSVELLAARILVDSAASVTSALDKVAGAIREFFQSVRPAANYDATENKWSVTLAGAPGRPTGAPLLADVLDGVERAARKRKKPVALVIDEFQKVITLGGADAEAQIRAAIQRHRAVGYVFAGSNTRLLADMTSDPRRPFSKLGEVRFVGVLPRDEFSAFLEDGFAASAIRVAPGAVDAILDLAEEVPYNVQLLAHECWEECRGARTVRLTPELVRKARDTAALRNDPLYSQLWNSLSATQQKALLAFLREKDSAGLTSTEVSRRYSIAVPSMQKALEALETKGIIREEQSFGAARLRLEDPLFGAWVELVVPT